MQHGAEALTSWSLHCGAPDELWTANQTNVRTRGTQQLKECAESLCPQLRSTVGLAECIADVCELHHCQCSLTICTQRSFSDDLPA
jgi:hypothetical protein